MELSIPIPVPERSKVIHSLKLHRCRCGWQEIAFVRYHFMHFMYKQLITCFLRAHENGVWNYWRYKQMMLKKMNLTRDMNKCYARLSGFVCCRYLDSCLRRCSQLFCSNNFALPNTNIDCQTNWNKNHEINTDLNCDKYKMFDSCLRRCSQLFWSSDFASAVVVLCRSIF